MLTKEALHKAEQPELDESLQKIVDVLEEHEDNENLQFAFEIAAMEALLTDLSVHSPPIQHKAAQLQQEAVDKRRKAIVKTLAQHAQNGTLTPRMVQIAKEEAESSDRVRVKEHERDGIRVKEHWRRIRGKVQETYDEALDRVGERVFAVGPDGEVEEQTGFQNLMDQIAAAPNRITKWGQGIAEGMSEFLSGSTWGERIINGAEYLSKTGNRIRFAARVVADYGPFVGMRMLHSYFRYGGYDVEVPEPGTKGAPPKGASREEVHNWAINRLQKKLPNEREYQLAGDHMPSEGFFVGRDGEVKAHAVGRGQDHFLPFGLSHLKQMRKEGGGEMIRRRAAGGITTEDLHIGMMMGLDQVTVVSNNGTFSMDITDRAKGLRSEHMQILGRFQDLVDSRGGRRGNAGFDAYDTAMGALALEFPLHFKKNESSQSPQSQQFRDRAVPNKTLIDEFRELFNGSNPLGPGPGAGSGREEGSTPDGEWVWSVNNAGRTIYNQSIFPGRRAGESEAEWKTRMRQAGNESAIDRAMERLGRQDWEHRRSRPQAGQQAQQRQPARRVSPDQARTQGTSNVLSASQALGQGQRFQPSGSTDTQTVTTTTASGAPRLSEEEKQDIYRKQRRAQQEAQSALSSEMMAEGADPSEGSYSFDNETEDDWWNQGPSDRELQILESMGDAAGMGLTDERTDNVSDIIDAAEDWDDPSGPFWNDDDPADS